MCAETEQDEEPIGASLVLYSYTPSRKMAKWFMLHPSLSVRAPGAGQPVSEGRVQFNVRGQKLPQKLVGDPGISATSRIHLDSICTTIAPKLEALRRTAHAGNIVLPRRLHSTAWSTQSVSSNLFSCACRFSK